MCLLKEIKVLREPDDEDTIPVIRSQNKHVVIVLPCHLLDKHGYKEVPTDPLRGELEMTPLTFPLHSQD